MSLFLVSYTDKAIAVFGEITKYENALLKIGGKFNPNLNYQGERKPGFIFPKTKSTIVSSFVQNPVEVSKQTNKEEIKIKGEEREKNVKETTQTIQQNNNKDVVMLSREQFLNLVNTLNRLEQDVAYLKKVVLQQNSQNTQKSEKIEKIEADENITRRKKTDKKEQKEEIKWADELSENSDSYTDNIDDEEEIEMPKLLKQNKSKTEEKSNKKPQSLLLKSISEKNK